MWNFLIVILIASLFLFLNPLKKFDSKADFVQQKPSQDVNKFLNETQNSVNYSRKMQENIMNQGRN